MFSVCRLACITLLVVVTRLPAQHPTDVSKPRTTIDSAALEPVQWSGERRSPNHNGHRQGVPVEGRIYGKVVDEKGAPLPYASVQIWSSAPQPEQRRLINGALTAENGDFSIDRVPFKQPIVVLVTSIGYEKKEQSLELALPSNPGLGIEKDLGNIKMKMADNVLKELVVESDALSISMSLDKTVFRLDKNAIVAGGTGEDALRQVPLLQVDMDGNVTLRNHAPQIFIDGRPTTLTPDQLPADAIDRIEVITNPSAKYDASGGGAGIVNIVLKQERRLGYNGQLRTGADNYRGYNFGADINIREGKWNFFANGNYNRRRNVTDGKTFRNTFGPPGVVLNQRNEGVNIGQHNNARVGVDWFINNRNTLTVAGNITQGGFNPLDSNFYTITTFADSVTTIRQIRYSDFERQFFNKGVSALYKKLFPEEGHELTADVNVNKINSRGDGLYLTRFEPTQLLSREKQTQENDNTFITAQLDYVRPTSTQGQIECGLRYNWRLFKSDMRNYRYTTAADDFVRLPNMADLYAFRDDVAAGYMTYFHKFAHWDVQLGTRIESSRYSATLPLADTAFHINFPISLFPTLFVSRRLSNINNIQLSLTRRINRPSFFQLIPFTDFSDSLNIQRGNPALRPEFTHSAEISYFRTGTKNSSILLTAFARQTEGLTLRHLFSEFNTTLQTDVVVVSFLNAGSSWQYGCEVTHRRQIRAVESVLNVNFYQSHIRAEASGQAIRFDLFSYIIKENINIKLLQQFAVQLSGQYVSPIALSSSGGGRWSGNSGGWGSGPNSTAQGYAIAYWFADASLRRDFYNRKLNVSLGVQDIFRSRRQGAFTQTDRFIQDTWRLRTPQQVRLNISYRFGKQDNTLFRRKNLASDPGDMMLKDF